MYKKFLTAHQPIVLPAEEPAHNEGREKCAAVVAVPDTDLAATGPDAGLPFPVTERLASI